MEHAPDDRPDHHADLTDAFDDLLANNKKFAERFDQHGFDGIAHAGVLIDHLHGLPDRALGDGWTDLR